jgi:molecular chaperone HtpG
VNRTFQVDLRGIVDLLSHHLSSSPRVYLPELLQHAVHAVTEVLPEVPDNVRDEVPSLLASLS